MLHVVDVRGLSRNRVGGASKTGDRSLEIFSGAGTAPCLNPAVEVMAAVAFRRNDLITRGLFHERIERDIEAHVAPRGGKTAVRVCGRGTNRREIQIRIVIVLQRKPNLFEIVRALHTTSRLARRLNRRQKETNQDTDNGDNHQEFNEREPALFERC